MTFFYVFYILQKITFISVKDCECKDLSKKFIHTSQLARKNGSIFELLNSKQNYVRFQFIFCLVCRSDHSPTYLLDLVPIDPNSITKSCLQDRLRLYQSFLRFSSLCCHSGSYYFRNPRIDIDKRRQLVSHSFRHFPILYL